jgi:hypothetical protein
VSTASPVKVPPVELEEVEEPDESEDPDESELPDEPAELDELPEPATDELVTEVAACGDPLLVEVE